MKIAFVGKGGSGKSSISWLAIKTLEETGKHILAIDADYNMDLTSNLGLDPESLPLMHKSDKEFMEALGLHEGRNLSSINHHSESLPTFTVHPQDKYTSSIATKVSDNLSLINIGLGSLDVIYQSKCTHGLSGPLKYYLGLLEEQDAYVVIDSVAGTDMLNYGLYAGIDAIIGVVEPHRNSVKVFEQIQTLCKRTMIPCYAIINKPSDNTFYTSYKEKHKEILLGEIPLDEGILEYDFSLVQESTKEAMKTVLTHIAQLKKRGGLHALEHCPHCKQ